MTSNFVWHVAQSAKAKTGILSTKTSPDLGAQEFLLGWCRHRGKRAIPSGVIRSKTPPPGHSLTSEPLLQNLRLQFWDVAIGLRCLHSVQHISACILLVQPPVPKIKAERGGKNTFSFQGPCFPLQCFIVLKWCCNLVKLFKTIV